MADPQDSTAAQEPSMEEILASIRKIIADDKDPSAPGDADAAGDAMVAGTTGDEIELAQSPTGELDTSADTSFTPPSVPAMGNAVENFTPVLADPAASFDGGGLVSDMAASAASSSFAALASKVQMERMVSIPAMTPIGAGRTLEDIVSDMLRPMLKEWLDGNLPEIVSRAVQREVERIARRGE